MMPSFVVDLPGGGGKRLAAAGVYDKKTGISKFTAPGLLGEKGQRTYEYHDPKGPNTIKVEKEDQPFVDSEEAQNSALHHDEYETPASKKVVLDYDDPTTAKSSRSRPSVITPAFPHSPPNKFDPNIWAPIKHNEVAPKAK